MRPGHVVADRFEIEDFADEGGMGVVYRALDRQTSSQVALKILRDSGSEDTGRFAREAQLLESVRHPGVVRYVDHGVDRDGHHYLAMEWLVGIDLGRKLVASVLTVAQTITLGRRVGEALGAAHARGVLHRDIKPANLFLRERSVDEVVVVDFGIARAANPAQDLTQRGLIVGTPSYMSPEQASGTSELTPAADVFALGAVLYECLAGRQAFDGDSAMTILLKIMLEEPPKLRDLRTDVPPALERLISRMLSKLPSVRPASGAEVAQELSRVPTSELEAAPFPVRRTPSARPRTLTTGERQLVGIALLAAADPGGVTIDQSAAMTMTPVSVGPDVLSLVRQIAERYKARVDRLLDGTIVASLVGRGAATDQAAQTARLGLAIRAAVPGHPLVLTTSRAVVDEERPIGDAIERATTLLRRERRAREAEALPRRIRIDDLTAALLDRRFETRIEDDARVLVGVRESHEGGRTLLGKQTPFVGRRRELGMLSAAFEGVAADHVAQAVLVTGPPGIGKSRLRQELVTTLRTGDAAPQIWLAAGDALRRGSPFGPFIEMVRVMTAMHDGEPESTRREKLRELLASRVGVDELAFIGELLGAPSEEASIALAAARQDGRLMGEQISRAFAAWARFECASRPLVIVLEDLHWSDLPTVKLLNELLRDLADEPLLVVALARPEVRDTFPDLWQERSIQEIRLGELGKNAAEELVRHALGAQATAENVARLVDRSSGNALFLEELVRAFIEGGGDTMPETVVAMVEARLQRFEPEGRRVLRAASIFGSSFWRDGLAELVGGSASVDTWLSQLIEREVIVRQREPRLQGQEELRFRHALFREAAYAMLTNDDLQLGHRLAGQWLEQAGERDPVVLADHFERGDDRDRAIRWYHRAAEQALTGDDAQAVFDRAERAIACGAEGEVLGALRALEADACLVVTGDLERTERYLTEALERLPRDHSLFYRAATSMIALGAFGRYQGLMDAIGMLLQDVTLEEVTTDHLFAWSNAIFFLAVAGQSGPARVLIERCELYGPSVVTKNPAALAWLHRARHYWRIYCDHAPERSYLDAQASARLLEQAGDHRELDWSEIHVGYSAVTLGNYAEGERVLRTVADRNRRADFPRAVAQNFLAGALSGLGRLDEAFAVQTEANAVFGTRANHLFLGVGVRRLALVHLERGDLDSAVREAKRAADMLFLSAPHRCYALAVQSLAEIGLGRSEEALRSSEDAISTLEAVGSIDRGASVIRLARAEALYSAGKLDDARVAIGRARDHLHRQLNAIENPTWREAYSQVSDHVRTMRLADEWGA